MRASEQKKPAVYVLVILPIFCGGAFCLAFALIDAYSRSWGMPRSAVPDRNGLLITIPALFLWIPASLLISNIVLNGIPPLRRIAKGYVARSDGPNLAKAQAQLLKALAVFALICIPLILLGFFI